MVLWGEKRISENLRIRFFCTSSGDDKFGILREANEGFFSQRKPTLFIFAFNSFFILQELKHPSMLGAAWNCCFSIVSSEPSKSLHLVAHGAEHVPTWVYGLSQIVESRRRD
jgi:hypothetical protein